MGCLASKPATDEQKQHVCKVCATIMMKQCVEEAMTDPKITIVAPPALSKIKDTSTKLRAAAKEFQAKADEEGEEAAEEAEPAESGGGGFGGFGGMLGKALNTGAEILGQAMDIAGDLGNRGVSKALEGMSEMLDQAVKKVEDPMTTIGQDLVAAKKTELTTSLKEFVDAADVPRAADLCDSEEPDAISKEVIKGAKCNVAKKLQPVVGEGVTKNPAISAWGTCIETYNGAIDKIVKMQETVQLPLADWAPEKIELDLKKYICEESVEQIGKLMGEAEGRRRAAPESTQLPEIFKKVFKKQDTKNMTKEEKDRYEIAKELTEADYKAVVQEHKDNPAPSTA